MIKLQLHNLKYLYNSKSTDGINNLNFKVSNSERVALIGPSGSGKSTTLKIIKELIIPQSGLVDTFECKVGYVAQSTQLDDDLTVFETLNQSLNYLADKEKQENQIRSTLSTLQITNDIHSPISNLSGGQRQRVIIALALVHNPQLILLDEPFGHLDQVLRFELIRELFDIFKSKDIAVLWVTHDTDEALAFSERVIVLNFGKIIQDDTPKKIYQEPANYFVAEFIGLKNTIIATYLKDKNSLELFNKTLQIDKCFETSEVILFCQNNAVTQDDDGMFSSIVENSYFYGDRTWHECKIEDKYVWVLANSDKIFLKGEKIKFNINLNYCHFSNTL